MSELASTAPETLAARLVAERYGIAPQPAENPAELYARIADVLELDLKHAPPELPRRRPRRRRNASRAVWAGLVAVDRLRTVVRGRGACRGSGVEFFPDADELAEAEYERACDLALSVCDSCPVRVECAELALRTNERFGIWGGMTEHERALELARRASHRQLTEKEAS